jgi:MFS transporter, ACS family, glucarate transporter
MGDRVGHRRVLTRIVVWWSAFTTLTGAAWNFGVLALTRFLFGAGEAGAYPNMSGVISNWFPITERARAQGIVWGASRIGGALSPLIVVPLMAWFGWRGTFYLFGGLGVVWGVVWFSWYRDHPTRQPGVSREELAEIRPAAACPRRTRPCPGRNFSARDNSG